MTKKAQRMLSAMDRATALWNIPNIGRAKGRVIRRLIERHRPTRAVEIGSHYVDLGGKKIRARVRAPEGASGEVVCDVERVWIP